ncbi:MAG: aminoacyl-tRNA deacylase [Streptosporangiaceae bacterium]
MTQVTEHLETHGVPFEPVAHQQAYTSIAEARALGIDASEVIKTVAMRVADGYALMAVPATCRLDMHLVQAAVGDRHVRLAAEEELLGDFPGIELGALPPLARCWARPSTSIRSCSSTKRWSLPQGARPNPFRSGEGLFCSRRDNGRFQDRQPCAACIKASQGW